MQTSNTYRPLTHTALPGRKALDTTWRGSFFGLAAVLRIVVHMVTLQERMLGPRYDCFGPWPVCPDSIVRRYAM